MILSTGHCSLRLLRFHKLTRTHLVRPSYLHLADLAQFNPYPYGRLPRPYPPRCVPSVYQDTQRYLPHLNHRPVIQTARYGEQLDTCIKCHGVEDARRAGSPGQWLAIATNTVGHQSRQRSAVIAQLPCSSK